MTKNVKDGAPDSRRSHEHGTVIVLVAVVMLFVVGAMAALSIDVVTLYTARSEAQLVADAAALAGARVLANSGLTSTNNNPGPSGAEDLARTVATQVAKQNQVGGRSLNSSGACAPGAEISVCFNDGAETFATNPRVTVTVQRTDLPTFFARIWGSTQLTVAASATAEAYNPSGVPATTASTAPPVAPLCVKPWLLPNLDPTGSANPIFNRVTGAIVSNTLVGQGWPGANNSNGLSAVCGDCSPPPGGMGIPNPSPGQYYPGAIDANDFPVPTQALPACSSGFNAYQLAVAACVPQPIVCGANSSINIDVNAYTPNNAAGRDADTVQAVECLIHYNNAQGDTDSIASGPPFQFLAGKQNPVASAVGKNVLVSDSLVTIPVIDYPGSPTQAPPQSVTVIGFLQVFLNPQSLTMPALPPAGANQIPATIINMAGCGIGAAGQPIIGNGASPVAVRLISGP